jgi:hypothetical protein
MIIVSVALAVNIGTAAFNLLQLRRWRQLNRAWLEICMMAWYARHSPGPLSVLAEDAGIRLRKRPWA